MKIHNLQSEVWIPRPREEVFALFSRAENLEALTPRWLHFSILSPGPIAMKAGTRIRYQLRLHDGIYLSVQALLKALNGIQEVINVYPATGKARSPGRPSTQTTLTEMDDTQQARFIVSSIWIVTGTLELAYTAPSRSNPRLARVPCKSRKIIRKLELGVLNLIRR